MVEPFSDEPLPIDYNFTFFFLGIDVDVFLFSFFWNNFPTEVYDKASTGKYTIGLG